MSGKVQRAVGVCPRPTRVRQADVVEVVVVGEPPPAVLGGKSAPRTTDVLPSGYTRGQLVWWESEHVFTAWWETLEVLKV